MELSRSEEQHLTKVAKRDISKWLVGTVSGSLLLAIIGNLISNGLWYLIPILFGALARGAGAGRGAAKKLKKSSASGRRRSAVKKVSVGKKSVSHSKKNVRASHSLRYTWKSVT